MHQLIEQLQRYHADKAQALNDLQLRVSALPDADEPSLVMQQIQDILKGFGGGAESHHHRNEELILAELRKTEAPIHRRVEEITGDHKAFAKILTRMLKLLEEKQDELELIATEVGEFIKNYEDHANTEEQIFFPAADQYLGADNWRRVEENWV